MLGSIEKILSSGKSTLLCVGPMSKNCVDATIELATQNKVPIILIASRRQIEAEALGRGYVENWSTEEFSQYISEKGATDYVRLARDHGGPWQGDLGMEGGLDLTQAMNAAKKSYEVDISSGFSFIHLDPSIDPRGTPSVDAVLNRLFELYGHCYEFANSIGANVEFEIGTEEQEAGGQNLEQFEYVLEEVMKFCNKSGFRVPRFVVAQTGTKVMEMRNVGSSGTKGTAHQKRLNEVLRICEKYGVKLKEHNTDYLPDEALLEHPKFGIHAANVAPEFGVAESIAFVEALEQLKLFDQVEEFIDLSYKKGKWQKWMLPNSKATKQEKALIGGHYVFSDPQFKRIKLKANDASPNYNIDDFLREKVKGSINRYLQNFNLISKGCNVYSAINENSQVGSRKNLS